MRRTIFLVITLMFTALLLPAQELVFFDGVVRVYERIDDRLFELQDSRDGRIGFGYRLETNYVVRTADGFAEILLPNGHILKLASNTEIYLERVIAAGASGGTDVVAVQSGRVRSVVASLTGTGRGFQVRTPTAVGGVRGTDFVTQVGSNTELIAVRQGLVEFTNAAGQSLSLAANQFANALAATFAASVSQNIVGQFYGALEQLSQQALDAQQAITGPPPAEPETEASEPLPAVQPAVVEPTAPSAEPTPRTADQREPGPVDALMATLTDLLGLEIGSITVEGETYSKLVVQPNFRIGKLRAGLYLPVIYSGNLFDMDDWYRPKGNNEWSFGTDQDWQGEPLVAFADLAGDLALKIKYIEWGAQRDPFFFKVGNLNTLTLGHGLLMRRYANDSDFPAVRRIGFNLGVDSGRFGFETVVNDLAAPEIFGLRLYTRPVPSIPIAVGLSGVTDIGPARELPSVGGGGDPLFEVERTTDPLFLNVALDLDLPIIERDALSLVLFADVGGLLPYLRNSAGPLQAGPQWNALVQATPDGGSELRNYGVAAGVFGSAFILDYRLEFQNFHGIFQPAFYDRNYDRIRAEKARETIAYLLDPTADAYASQTIGVYGEAGFSIADLVILRAGYLWPWTRDAADQIVVGDNDYLLASLDVKDGLLPLGISAGITYERSYFAPTLLGRDGFASARLFDENTVLKGEIVYPVAPIMDIVASITTTLLRDTEGNLIYSERNGVLRPKYGPVISIETRLGGAGF